MKTYKATNKVSPQLKEAIKNTIATNDKYKTCYFWNNTGSASNRRSQERKFDRENPGYAIETQKGMIEVRASLQISCKNFYYTLEVTRYGKKSNISILKNMIGA